MILQPPQPIISKKWVDILCHKCGAKIVFDKNHVSSSGKKIPLQPKTNGEPHIKYCMYATTSRSDLGVESILSKFLLISKPKREIWAVGKARE